MLDDFFPGIDLKWDDKGVSGWIKRNGADVIHWCTILLSVGFVVWSAVVLALGIFFGMPESASQPPPQEAVPDTAGFQPRSGGGRIARKQPPWWWGALLDAIKTLTPLALPFVTNYARKHFKTDSDDEE